MFYNSLTLRPYQIFSVSLDVCFSYAKQCETIIHSLQVFELKQETNRYYFYFQLILIIQPELKKENLYCYFQISNNSQENFHFRTYPHLQRTTDFFSTIYLCTFLNSEAIKTMVSDNHRAGNPLDNNQFIIKKLVRNTPLMQM